MTSQKLQAAANQAGLGPSCLCCCQVSSYLGDGVLYPPALKLLLAARQPMACRRWPHKLKHALLHQQNTLGRIKTCSIFHLNVLRACQTLVLLVVLLIVMHVLAQSHQDVSHLNLQRVVLGTVHPAFRSTHNHVCGCCKPKVVAELAYDR